MLDTSDHQSFKRFLASCPNLVNFYAKFPNVERKKLFDFIESICQECPFLKELCIHNFSKVDNLHQFPESTIFVDNLIVHIKALKNLAVLSIDYSMENFTIFKGVKFNKLKELKCQFHSVGKLYSLLKELIISIFFTDDRSRCSNVS